MLVTDIRELFPSSGLHNVRGFVEPVGDGDPIIPPVKVGEEGRVELFKGAGKAGIREVIARLESFFSNCMGATRNKSTGGILKYQTAVTVPYFICMPVMARNYIT